MTTENIENTKIPGVFIQKEPSWDRPAILPAWQFIGFNDLFSGLTRFERSKLWWEIRDQKPPQPRLIGPGIIECNLQLSREIFSHAGQLANCRWNLVARVYVMPMLKRRLYNLANEHTLAQIATDMRYLEGQLISLDYPSYADAILDAFGMAKKFTRWDKFGNYDREGR